MEDREIVELYWQRNESALTVTAAKYGNYCSTIANNILHNACDAEECVNDTYIGAWNSMPDNKPENLGHYLGRMTRWLSLNRLDERRSRKRGGNLPEALPLDELADCASCEAGTEELVEYKELCAAINRFLSGLHPVVVMALSVLLTLTGGRIRGAEAVAKSYPDFFEAMRALGILVTEEEEGRA